MFIDKELHLVDLYLSQGYDFQEVFELVKSSIQSCISSKLIPVKALSPTPSNDNRSYSTDKVKSSRYSIIGNNHHVKNKESWQDYNQRHQVYYKEFIKISQNFEKAQLNAYRNTPDIEYQSRIDEIRAAEAAKQRELQSQEIEFKRKIDQIVAERENAATLSRQIQEKRNVKSSLRLESRQYRDELDSRNSYMKVIESSERERRNLEKDLYSQALNQQVLNKNDQRMKIRQMEKYAASICNSSECSYPETDRSVSSSVLKKNNNLKFLVQYGHYVPVKGKGN